MIEPLYMHKNVYARLTWLVTQRVKAEAKLSRYEGKDKDYIKKWHLEALSKRESIKHILNIHKDDEKVQEFYKEIEKKEADKWQTKN